MYYIGIDIGSTYVKSVLIDMEAGKARQEQRFPAPAKRELKNRRCFEISAEELLAMVRTQAECFADLYEDIKGVILSTQMHGFVYCTEGRRIGIFHGRICAVWTEKMNRRHTWTL